MAILICALSLTAVAFGDYKAKPFAGKIGPKGERQALTFTHEKLAKRERLVNDAHFENLTVECSAPRSEQAVEGVLAAFHQPSPAWVISKRKKVGGPKDFKRAWRGKGVPIEASDSSGTKFRGKRAEFKGKFRKGFRKARGSFSIRWKEVSEKSGEVVYACGTTVRWSASVQKRSAKR